MWVIDSVEPRTTEKRLRISLGSVFVGLGWNPVNDPHLFALTILLPT